MLLSGVVKKCFLAILSAAMLLSLTACGNATIETSQDEPSVSQISANSKENKMESEWVFKKEKHNLHANGILRLFDEENDVCVNGETGAMILGKIWRLFGEPHDGGSSEIFYLYEIKAEAPDKEPVYLLVDQYNDMPTIRYAKGVGEEAAKALAEEINKASPADFEWSAVYDDYDVRITYSVRNGKAYSKDEMIGI